MVGDMTTREKIGAGFLGAMAFLILPIILFAPISFCAIYRNDEPFIQLVGPVLFVCFIICGLAGILIMPREPNKQDAKCNSTIRRKKLSQGGLTDQEKRCSDHLVAAYNEFIKLERQHPDEMREFIDGLHKIQGVLATRVVRRLYPDFWQTYDNRGEDWGEDIDNTQREWRSGGLNG